MVPTREGNAKIMSLGRAPRCFSLSAVSFLLISPFFVACGVLRLPSLRSPQRLLARKGGLAKGCLAELREQCVASIVGPYDSCPSCLLFELIVRTFYTGAVVLIMLTCFTCYLEIRIIQSVNGTTTRSPGFKSPLVFWVPFTS